MLNDNAPALSKDISIKDKSIQEASVKKQITFQESIIKEKRQLIVEAESDIRLAEDTLAFLQGISSGATYNNAQSTEQRNFTGFEPSRKQMVLEAITGTINPNGIMNPEIKESIYRKYGISVSSTTIDDKARELMTEDRIYQTNEGKQRGRRYLPKK